jgi:hypothetical protein
VRSEALLYGHDGTDFFEHEYSSPKKFGKARARLAEQIGPRTCDVDRLAEQIVSGSA